MLSNSSCSRKGTSSFKWLKILVGRNVGKDGEDRFSDFGSRHGRTLSLALLIKPVAR